MQQLYKNIITSKKSVVNLNQQAEVDVNEIVFQPTHQKAVRRGRGA